MGYEVSLTVAESRRTAVVAARTTWQDFPTLWGQLLREVRETAYQFRAPFVIDASKFEAAFGPLEPTPHRDAVQRTVAWYRSRSP